MVLANFCQNRFFKNRHPMSFTICLSLPFWSHYPTLSIFLVTTSRLILQLYIFHFGSCSFLYLEPFYIRGPGRSLWWVPSSQPWHTQIPWMCFLCLNSTPSPNSFPTSLAVCFLSLPHGVSYPPSGHTKLAPTLPLNSDQPIPGSLHLTVFGFSWSQWWLLQSQSGRKSGSP